MILSIKARQAVFGLEIFKQRQEIFARRAFNFKLLTQLQNHFLYVILHIYNVRLECTP